NIRTRLSLYHYTTLFRSNGFTGIVQDVGIFLTHVLLDAGTPAVFPNSVIISSLIINHSRVIWRVVRVRIDLDKVKMNFSRFRSRSEEHTSELKSRGQLVC